MQRSVTYRTRERQKQCGRRRCIVLSLRACTYCFRRWIARASGQEVEDRYPVLGSSRLQQYAAILEARKHALITCLTLGKKMTVLMNGVE